MKRLFLGLILALAPAAALAEPAPAEAQGDWSGRIDTGAGQLTIVAHVGPDRVLFDSPDQKSFGLPGTFGRNGSAYRIELPLAGAAFEGKLTQDGKAMEGMFYQGGGSLALTLTRTSATATLPPPSLPAPPELRGDWQGKLAAPNGTVTLVMHLADVSTVGVLEQPAPATPANLQRDGDGWKIAGLASVFTGKLSADGQTLTGQVVQAGQAIPLTLTRKAAGEPSR